MKKRAGETRGDRVRLAAFKREELAAGNIWCAICGGVMNGEPGSPTRASVDHIVPLWLGGTHDRSNLRLAHRICNQEMGVRMAPENIRRRNILRSR